MHLCFVNFSGCPPHRVGVPTTSRGQAWERVCGAEECWSHMLHELCLTAGTENSGPAVQPCYINNSGNWLPYSISLPICLSVHP